MLRYSTVMGLLSAVALTIVPPVPLAPEAHAQAAGEADCAIWLCLPQAFAVPGCGPARRAFLRRIPFRPPLPPLLACVVPGSSVNGSFTQGTEDYEDCEEGFEPSLEFTQFRRGGEEFISEDFGSGEGQRVCVKSDTCANPGTRSQTCGVSYTPARRTDRNYVEVHLEGVSQGRYYYSNPE